MHEDIKTQLEYYRTQAIFWFVMTIISSIIFYYVGYTRNKELAKSFREKPCVVCDAPGVGDHILNFKRIPSRDEEWNMWALCFECHREKTDSQSGLAGFVRAHGLKRIIESKGFYYIEESDKWWHLMANG